MAALRIAEDFTLPPEAVTETFGILAKRGVGKTYTSAVMIEEMIKAGLPAVVVDPIGVWWGLRSSADGEHPGLPVTILGGEHGDIPLEPTGGELVANLLVDSPTPLVLDLSGMRKGEARRFMTDFLEQLYQANRKPLHVVLDEADEWAPQRPVKGAERLLGACEDLVRRGRARGLGCTLITQRPAVIHKDVLTQIEVLVALRIIGPQDRAAIDDWIKVHGTAEQRTELLGSLAKLPVGTAWWWSPGWLDVFQQVRVRRRETFDSSATPKMGERPITPRSLADVDLASLKERMADTIERARAADPKVLQREIRDLKRKVAELESATTTTVVETVEVPVLPPEMLDELRDLLAPVAGSLADVQAAIAGHVAAPRRVERPAPRPTPAPPVRSVAPPVDRQNGEAKLSKVERSVLTVLAQYPAGRTRTQLTTLAGYTWSGGFRNGLAALRSAGYIVGGNGDVMRATDAGIEALGDWEPLPTGPDLLAFWLSEKSLGKAERAVLSTLVEQYPERITGSDLAGMCGYEFSGGFRNALSKLRTLELITGSNTAGVAAHEDFIEAIRG